MKILVTGCAGFIGSHACEELLASGYEVLGVDNMDPYYPVEIKVRNIELLKSHSSFRFREEDIQKTTAITDWKPDTVLHLASMAGVRASIAQPLKYVDVNVAGFVHILQECTKNMVEHLVYASSSSVYGTSAKIPFKEDEVPPEVVSPYAASKRAMELFGSTHSYLHGLSCIGLRFFTVYGPRGRPDMAPHKFLSAIIDGRTFEKFGTGSSRDYTYVGDIVRGIRAALLNVQPGRHRMYNLGNSKAVSLERFITICENVVGKDAQYTVVDRHPADVPHTCADISRATAELGYRPSVSLESGLRKCLEDIVASRKAISCMTPSPRSTAGRDTCRHPL